MANSMDEILVRYGTSLTKQEQDLLWYAPDDESKKRQAELKRKIKLVKIPDFLAIPTEKLSDVEQKIQRALSLVYTLNGKEPPLFQKFPTFRSQQYPLTIDITTAGNSVENCAAAYHIPENLILFKHTQNADSLVNSIAHELKHAEQTNQEIYELDQHGSDNYMRQQVDFLKEAQAYATAARAVYEIFQNAKTQTKRYHEVSLYEQIFPQYTDAKGHKDFKKIEEEMIKVLLDRLYTSKYYKDLYDRRSPIRKSDKGLMRIPESLHLPQSLMEKLRNAPREAMTLSSKLLQAQNDNQVDEYICLVNEAIRTKQKITPSLRFISEQGSPQQVQEALKMKQDNQYVFDNEQVRYLFDDLAQEDVPTPLIKQLLMMRRGEEPVIDIPTLINVLKWKKTPEQLNTFLKIIQTPKGQLPLSEKECLTTHGTNSILDGHVIYTEKSLNNFIQTLPKLLKLTGKDGKNLISEKCLAKHLNTCCIPSKNPQFFRKLCNALKDTKGCLPFSREALYIQDPQNKEANGQNIFLYALPIHNSSYEKYAMAILPFIMSLKDKDGKPIISLRDIQRFPKNHKLAKAVKAYAKKSKTKVKEILTAHTELPLVSKVKQFVVRLWNHPR